MRRLAWILVGAACGAPQAKLGSDKDEGAGLLARASTKLETSDDTSPGLADNRKPVRAYAYGGATYGGDRYGGAAYGGDPYGGASYAHWTMPAWSFQPPNRVPRYSVVQGLDAAIEGAVTWTGAAPAKVTTKCGVIDNPSLRVGTDHGLRGVVVYIEHVTKGRAVPYYGHPTAVGGMIAKHGCALGPAAQIVVPLPASISIHGDGQRARVRVTPTGAAPKLFDLQEGGVAQAEVQAGVTKIDGEDGKLTAAWVLGLETPYYAITDDAGRFRLDELAPGTYDVTFWQPPIATSNADGVIAYGAPIVVHRSVVVERAHTAKLSVALSSH